MWANALKWILAIPQLIDIARMVIKGALDLHKANKERHNAAIRKSIEDAKTAKEKQEALDRAARRTQSY